MEDKSRQVSHIPAHCMSLNTAAKALSFRLESLPAWISTPEK